MKKYLSAYNFSYPAIIVYMLQASEYKINDYLSWLKRTKDFEKVKRRSNLDYTAKAKILLASNYFIAISLGAIFYFLVFFSITLTDNWLFLAAVILVLTSPWLIARLILLPLVIGRYFVQLPKEKRLILEARNVFENHNGTKIAIVGSFGKTTAKEVLKTVLSEGKKVASTPGNMNTPIGISRFAKKLSGDEDVLIIEMGEAKIGDIKELCEIAKPDMGIITGINEAHLSTFGTIENTVKTIFELTDFVDENKIYKNSESPILKKKIKKDDDLQYSHKGLNGWAVSDIKTAITGMDFTVKKGKQTLRLKTGLLGQHNIGILLVAVDIAANMGFSDAQIIEGVSKTEPFEHRFKPRNLGGAWIIDDTYNGNSEGVTAGLKFLDEIEAKRKIYVTPGLVEQGDKTVEIHEKIGREIAAVADIAVLMKNSTTEYILNGLKSADYKGETKVIDDPLSFYQNLEHFVAAGDVVLMQNDWTDNYA